MVFVFVFVALVIEGAYRGYAADARSYKHSKTYVRKGKKENPFWKRFLGVYTLPDCKAPNHLQKYQRIRLINLLAVFACALIHKVLPPWSVFVYICVFLAPISADYVRLYGVKKMLLYRWRRNYLPLEFDKFPNP